MAFVAVAAVLALTAVTVAERFEQRMIDAPVVAAPVNTLESVALASGTMALTLGDGAAIVTTGVDAPAIELATATIGDVELVEAIDDVVIAQVDDEVSYDWGDVTEWYRSVPEGIEHGYTIDAPLSDSDDLAVTIGVTDGTPTLVDADTVSIARPGASTIWYQGLVAFDADGTDLPAAMAVVDGSIELRVDTGGAVYPVTIDPIISDAQVVRVAGANAPRLADEPATPRLAGAAAGGGPGMSSCASNLVMTGLTVYPRVGGSAQLRVVVARCREVQLVDEQLVLVGPAVDAADLGNRSGVLAAQTRDCAAGSAVTGLAAEVGLLIDRLAVRCSPMLATGGVGSPTTQSDLFGGGSLGVTPAGPVDCTAGFATGLSGTFGDDIVSVGLRCATVTIGNDAGSAAFGSAVDVDGDRMVASAPSATVAGVVGAGKVFVYERVGGAWAQTAEIVSPSPETDGGFGDSLDLRGGQLAIGESNRGASDAEPGRVWAFGLVGGTWTLLREFSAPAPEGGPDDLFGADVAWIDADDLYVGAPGVGGAGAVYRANTTSGATTNATPALIVSALGDDFGFSVDVTPRPDAPGYWAAIGVPGIGGDGGGYYIVTLDADGNSVGWRGGSGLAAGTRFGTSVAIDGNRVVIGRYGNGTMGFSLYEYRDFGGGIEWASEVARSVGTSAGFEVGTPANDYLDIDGEYVVIGQPGSGGRVAIFRFDGGVLADAPTFAQPAGREAGDRVGRSLELDGSLLVAGAPGDDGATNEFPDSGAVYTFGVTPDVPDEPVFASFDVAASASQVSVASSGIAASAIPSRNASGATGQSGSVASTSLVGLDLNTPVGGNVAASPVASLTIGESVLAAIDGASSLDRLPLTDIDVTVPIASTTPPQVGGWEEILRQIDDPVLLSRPPQNIQFGEIKDFPEVQRLRLDQLSLAGTPVASLPVASLVLGATPVASLGTDIDWCAEIAATGSAANCSNGIDPTTATLVELTLAGIPVASLPVASLPVASLPVASLPVASLPVASLDLASTPVASLPVASLPVASLPVASLPVASLPVASLQVDIVDAAGNLASLPVASLPVASLPVASLPVASLPVASLPVASLNTTGTVLFQFTTSANRSLISIPVASLNLLSSPVASLPVASLPVASLPVASLPVASLPVASLPVASLPVASLDVTGTPVASLTTDGTLATLPVASLPVASLPVASLPVAGLPVASLPVASLPVASLPVASLPVASLPVASLPVASLPVASLPVASLPVASLPVASLPVASLSAVVDCTAVDCTSTTLSFADALAAAPVSGATFAALAPLLDGLRWGEILPFLGVTDDEFVQMLVDLENSSGGTFTLGDVVNEGGGFGDLTVGELPPVVLQRLFFGDIAPYLEGFRLGDLVGNILDAEGNPLDAAAVEAALTAAKNGLTLQLLDLTNFDDLTLGDLVDESGNPLLQGLTLGQVAPYLTGLRFDDLFTSFPGLTENQVRNALEDILATSGLTLGQLLVGDLTFDDLLASDEFGQITLAQLLSAILEENPDALDGITFGDLLLAFVSPSDYPWDSIVFDDIDPADLPGLVGAVTFDTRFELTGTTRGTSVEVAVTLPDTAGYLPGASSLNGSPLAEPTIVGKVLTWRLTGIAPDTPYTLSFDLQPTLELGSSTVDVAARIIGVADGAVEATSSVAVEQAFEPNNTPETAAPLAENTIYINHVASADDLDYFKIDVTDGQRVVVNLSNLAADFDVVVYGRSQSSTIVPLVPSSGQSAGTPTPDPVFEPDGTTQVQSELTGAASSFDGLPIVATGNRRGTETETVVTPPLEEGTVYVKVFGANGESSVRAAVLQAKVTEGTSVPECPALTERFDGGTPGTSSIPADANTLFLVNQQRLSALYPDDYTGVFSSLDALVDFLNVDGADLGIVPGVLDVGQITGIAADYAAWDAEPCDSSEGERRRGRDRRRDHTAAHDS